MLPMTPDALQGRGDQVGNRVELGSTVGAKPEWSVGDAASAPGWELANDDSARVDHAAPAGDRSVADGVVSPATPITHERTDCGRFAAGAGAGEMLVKRCGCLAGTSGAAGPAKCVGGAQGAAVGTCLTLCGESPWRASTTAAPSRNSA